MCAQDSLAPLAKYGATVTRSLKGQFSRKRSKIAMLKGKINLASVKAPKIGGQPGGRRKSNLVTFARQFQGQSGLLPAACRI